MKQVTILQLKKTEENMYKMFFSLRSLKNRGLEVNVDDYREVWSGEMDVEDPEDVFMKLQFTKPEGYKGHSLSVSDIVKMDGELYYCDSYSFVKLSSLNKAA